MTDIYELSRYDVASGGKVTIVLRTGAVAGYEPYAVGTVKEVPLGNLPGRRQRLLDVARGATGRPRREIDTTYAASLDVIPRDLDGYVFVHNAPGALRSLARARPDVPICLYAHNTLFKTYSRREARKVIDATYRVICVSDFLAEQIHGKLGRRDERIRTVRNGIDTTAFAPGPPRPAGKPPVVLFLGRVVPAKGADLLVRAALLLQERGVPLRLRIVGSSGFSATDALPPYETRLRKAAAPLGNCMEFVPFQDRTLVPTIYRDADVFCAPANWDEPLCLSVMEAMATGLPCVVSKRGGIPEVGGEAVRYFRPPDHVELARALEELLTSEQVRQRLGAKARTRATELTWAKSYGDLSSALA